MTNKEKSLTKQIDWVTTIIPFAIVLCLMFVFMIFPEQSKARVDSWRTFFGDTIGIYYSIIGIACVLIALYWAFS
jgi:BCCT family betaine/carnitine transporter